MVALEIEKLLSFAEAFRLSDYCLIFSFIKALMALLPTLPLLMPAILMSTT